MPYVASVYPKPFQSFRHVANVVHAPATQTYTLRVELDKLHFLAEHRITFGLQQAYAVAPDSFDVRKVIERFQIKFKNGNLRDLDGAELINLSRMRGGASLEKATLGLASSATFCLDLYYILQNAKHDLITGIHSGELTTFDLEITFAASFGFVGGTLAASPNQVATVDIDALFYDYYDGNADVGKFFNMQCSARKEFSGSGEKDRIKLDLFGQNRFIMFSLFTINIDGSLTANDNILSSVTLKFDDAVMREYEVFELKSDAHEAFDGFNQPGVYVINFGDDDAGWPNFAAAESVSLVLSAAAGSPDKWLCKVVQDQVVVKGKLNS